MLNISHVPSFAKPHVLFFQLYVHSLISKTLRSRHLTFPAQPHSLTLAKPYVLILFVVHEYYNVCNIKELLDL